MMKKRVYVTAVDKCGLEIREHFDTYEELLVWLNQYGLKIKRTRTQYVYIGEVTKKSKTRKGGIL